MTLYSLVHDIFALSGVKTSVCPVTTNSFSGGIKYLLTIYMSRDLLKHIK